VAIFFNAISFVFILVSGVFVTNESAGFNLLFNRLDWPYLLFMSSISSGAIFLCLFFPAVNLLILSMWKSNRSKKTARKVFMIWSILGCGYAALNIYSISISTPSKSEVEGPMTAKFNNELNVMFSKYENKKIDDLTTLVNVVALDDSITTIYKLDASADLDTLENEEETINSMLINETCNGKLYGSMAKMGYTIIWTYVSSNNQMIISLKANVEDCI